MSEAFTFGRCHLYHGDMLEVLPMLPKAACVLADPPYGRKLEPFVRKAALEAAKGKLVVALIPFRCRASWWHQCVLGRAAEVRCVRKRIKFLFPNGEQSNLSGTCDSCIVIWNGPTQQTLLRAA